MSIDVLFQPKAANSPVHASHESPTALSRLKISSLQIAKG
jgi:hypothetical protein